MWDRLGIGVFVSGGFLNLIAIAYVRSILRQQLTHIMNLSADTDPRQKRVTGQNVNSPHIIVTNVR